MKQSVKIAQLPKLIKTLVNSGLSQNYAEAEEKAREMLNIKDIKKANPDTEKSLPKAQDIAPIAPSLDEQTKEILKEDALKIYKKLIK